MFVFLGMFGYLDHCSNMHDKRDFVWSRSLLFTTSRPQHRDGWKTKAWHGAIRSLSAAPIWDSFVVDGDSSFQSIDPLAVTAPKLA